MRNKLLVSLAVIIALAPALAAWGNESGPPPMDVMILVDVSGSMRFTDPGRDALSAVADFIDKLAPGESRVGVIGFSGRIPYSIPFEYTDAERKIWLRDEISRFLYVGYTDIGLALLTAADMFGDISALRNPMVIMTSDGYIEISRLNISRTAEMSYLDVEAALDIFDRTVPIYTIGMHNPAGVDVALLEMIALRSGGLSKFTYDAKELPEIMAAIFEHRVASLEQVEPDDESEDTYEDYSDEGEDLGDEEPEPPNENPENETVSDEIEINNEESAEAEATSGEIAETAELADDAEPAARGFGFGILHYLAMFFGLTALVSILRFIKIALY